jgi:3-oxoadipate enol-lactonase
MWQPQWQALATRYRVTCYDVRGHGRSAAPATGYSRDACVNELRGFLRALGIERCHLIGSAMGGALALGFALRHQRAVASLVLVGSLVAGHRPAAPLPAQDLGRLARESGLDAARAGWLQEPILGRALANPACADLVRAMAGDHSLALWRDPAAETYPEPDDVERLGELRVPTLAIVGAAESPEVVALNRRIAGEVPAAELAVLEDAGHLASLEQPAPFTKLVLDFLGRADHAGR